MNRRQALVTLSSGLVLPGLWRGAGAEQVTAQAEILDSLATARTDGQADQRLTQSERQLLERVLGRLGRLQKLVGHANYNLLDYPQALKLAAGYKRVGGFGGEEKAFIERLFYADAAGYGFAGPRLLEAIDYRIEKSQREKVRYSGHYLFRSSGLQMYRRLNSDIGEQLILTSGIRGVIKQTHLFLARVRYSRGNLSDAARSLAPPAYSFHSVGDFDVGQRDFGYANFTRRFTESEVYRRLSSLDYVRNRYARGNPLGMRFEPWHVEVERA